MQSLKMAICVLLSISAIMHGCASIPGDTVDEKISTADALVERSLADLYEQNADAKNWIADSFGYVVIEGTETKIPIMGAGSGYGVAIHTRTEEKTYLKITEFELGAGLGRKSVRFVIIFQDQEEFNAFAAGLWKLKTSMGTSSRSKDAGAIAGAEDRKGSVQRGYSIHYIADSGASATATLGIFRASPIKLEK